MNTDYISLEEVANSSGFFNNLLSDIRHCKENDTCPNLTSRQFYFEPNPETISKWNEEGAYLNGIYRRAIFICESPGPSADQKEAWPVMRCWANSWRDARFREAREKYGLHNCYITNIVKCGTRNNGKHDITEIKACEKYILLEISYIMPKVLICLGGNVFHAIRKMTRAHNINIEPVLIYHYSVPCNPWQNWDKKFPAILSKMT